MAAAPSLPGLSRNPAAGPLQWPPLVVIGLTGGIASGKSTVARLMAEAGATVLNADEEGRAVVEPGEPALAEIVREFGAEYLGADGRLERRLLGERVFGSPRDLAALNRITHPRIDERLRERLRTLQRTPPDPPLVVLEAAILLEAGWETLVDRVLVVVTQPSLQASRLTAESGLTEPQAWARIRSQLPLRRRIRRADLLISGETPLEVTRRRVREIRDEVLGWAGRS